MSTRRFPVLSPTSRKQQELREQLGCPTSVPWEMLAPHEERARRNHDQSLERLAERGGLSPMEMVCVLGDKRWEPTEPAWAILRLKELVAEWELRTRAPDAT